MTIMSIRGFNLDQLTEAAKYLQTAEGAKQRDYLIAKANVPVPAKQPRKKKVPAIIAIKAFWEAHHAAQMRIQRECGERWYLDKSQYYLATVPVAFRSYKGQAVAKIKMPADIKVPLRCYWPGETIPEIGMTLHQGR